MGILINGRVQTAYGWKDNPILECELKYRLDPWDGFESAQPHQVTLERCLKAQRDYLQDFNLLAFHIHSLYGVPLNREVTARKRRGLKWISVGGYDYSCNCRGEVSRRKAR